MILQEYTVCISSDCKRRIDKLTTLLFTNSTTKIQADIIPYVTPCNVSFCECLTFRPLVNAAIPVPSLHDKKASAFVCKKSDLLDLTSSGNGYLSTFPSDHTKFSQ